MILQSTSGRHVSAITTLLLSAFIWSHCAAQVPETPIATPIQNELSDPVVGQVVQPFLQDRCHVGLSIVIVQQRAAHFYNFGSTSRTDHIKPTSDSVYEIASVTKTFTGALAAKALLQHRMQLDGDFRHYLPERYPNLAWQAYPVTLRTLSTHTSGLPRDLPDTDDLFANRDPDTLPYKLIERDSGYDRARYLEALHDVTLRSRPGATENYSNLGFKVIGWGLETVFRMPFEHALQQQILRPVAMKSTGFVLRPDQHAHLVKGYNSAGNLMPYHLRNAGAAYGLYSTPRDMGRYVAWQLDETDPVVRQAHLPIEGDVRGGKALVWNLSTLDHGRMLWHGGGTFGTSSEVVLFPDTREGYVLLANDACTGTESTLKTLAIALHQRLALNERAGTALDKQP